MRALLVGCNGMLGRKVRQLAPKTWALDTLDRPDIDFCQSETVEAALVKSGQNRLDLGRGAR